MVGGGVILKNILTLSININLPRIGYFFGSNSSKASKGTKPDRGSKVNRTVISYCYWRQCGCSIVEFVIQTWCVIHWIVRKEPGHKDDTIFTANFEIKIKQKRSEKKLN